MTNSALPAPQPRYHLRYSVYRRTRCLPLSPTPLRFVISLYARVFRTFDTLLVRAKTYLLSGWYGLVPDVD